MPLDLLASVLLSMVAALPSTEEGPDLGLSSASVIEMGGQGSSEDKPQKAIAAFLRTTCEHLLSCTTGDGSPYGGIQHVGAFIVLPSSVHGSQPLYPLQENNTATHPTSKRHRLTATVRTGASPRQHRTATRTSLSLYGGLSHQQNR